MQGWTESYDGIRTVKMADIATIIAAAIIITIIGIFTLSLFAIHRVWQHGLSDHPRFVRVNEV